ncbi:MAG TPA: prepilin-type N-terminal cleavage/methylation domain-containing protein [Candidatus Binatia bacterium]|nr:prepilin-type N-terminal cleavage/methylation domain-containing protein [Candidatus Binatia bacterium]
MAIAVSTAVSKPGSVSGFSLLEILIVTAIISLLAAIAIPQFTSYRLGSIDSQMKSDLRNAATAMESYYGEHKIYPISVNSIKAVGFRQTDGVTLDITVTPPSSFTLTASKPGGNQPSFTYDSTTGNIN